MTIATTDTIRNLAGATAVIDLAEKEAETSNRIATVKLGAEVVEGQRFPAHIWVLGPTRIQLTGGNNYLDLPLRYQYMPGWGPSRLITRDEAVALVMLSFVPAVEVQA